MINYSKYKNVISTHDFIKYSGRVSQVVGLTIESIGPAVNLGEICHIYPVKSQTPIIAEVVGFKNNIVSLMPLGDMSGIGPGSKVEATGKSLSVKVDESLLGRILDGLGNPIDDKKMIDSKLYYSSENTPPNPLTRKKIRDVLPLGVKCIDGLLTIGKGQRVGIFAGSGVG
ncbi:MAG: fliI, partial [Clostridia bacterium]|nr:fliI [Clostridia bacterium]